MKKFGTTLVYDKANVYVLLDLVKGTNKLNGKYYSQKMALGILRTTNTSKRDFALYYGSPQEVEDDLRGLNLDLKKVRIKGACAGDVAEIQLPASESTAVAFKHETTLPSIDTDVAREPVDKPVDDVQTSEFDGKAEPGRKYIYTDGSASPNRDTCGWAFVVYDGNNEVFAEKGSQPVRENARRATFLAEFLAVLNAMDYIISQQMSDVTICYDNVQVFNLAIAESSRDIALFHKYTGYMMGKWQEIEALGLSVKMAHVKAHSGIPGNEKADSLAKWAAHQSAKYFF